jgi:hypothetical protein
MEGEGPRLLDLIPKERGWVCNEVCKVKNGLDEKLELTLGLPGGETLKDEKQSVFLLNFSENVAKRPFLRSVDTKEGDCSCIPCCFIYYYFFCILHFS